MRVVLLPQLPVEGSDHPGTGRHRCHHQGITEARRCGDHQRVTRPGTERGFDFSKIGDHGIDQPGAQQ